MDAERLVEGGIGKGKGCHLSIAQRYLPRVDRSCITPSCQRDHGRREIDTGNEALRSLGCQEFNRYSWSKSHFQHPIRGLDVKQRDRPCIFRLMLSSHATPNELANDPGRLAILSVNE